MKLRGPQPWRTNRSRVLRSKASEAEDILWSELRNRRLNGMKFVRQAPIGSFFVDFLCREHKLVVEVDGGTHSTDEELRRDGRRTRTIEELGSCVLRVDNDEVTSNTDGVLDAVLQAVEAQK